MKLRLVLLSVIWSAGLWMVGARIPYVNILRPLLLPWSLIFTVVMVGWFWPQVRKTIFGLGALFSLFLWAKGSEHVFLTLWFTLVFAPRFELAPAANVIGELVKKISSYVRGHQWLVFGAVTFGLVLIFYWRALNFYFEGDEWVFFRFSDRLVRHPAWFAVGFLDTFIRRTAINLHLIPLANMIYVIQYRLFGLQYLPYILTSFALHTATVLAFGWFVESLAKNRKLSFVAALLFALSAQQWHAVTWVIAAVNTQLAVLFGFLSLRFLVVSLEQSAKRKHRVFSAILLLCALFSKETAIVFLFMYPVVGLIVSPQQSRVWKRRREFLAVVGIFSALQLTRLPLEKFTTLLGRSDNAPIAYKIFDLIESIPQQWLFRWGSFSLKSFGQALLPSNFIIQVGVWITDHHFPFFNQEKAVGGPTYASFIFSVMPELVSYSFSLLFIAVLFYLRGRFPMESRIRRFSVAFYLLGIIPILAIILKFPWWGYTSIVDSRHLYHLTPAISLLLAAFFIELGELLDRKWSIMRGFFLGVLLFAWLTLQYSSLQSTLKKQAKSSSFPTRKAVIASIQRGMTDPPKKLILFTTSNQSYYGFAQQMLPFQTAFSHMLPVLFSRSYHPNGNVYPESFFSDGYLPKGGLVTQGYHEDGDYGLGYFLDKVQLIRTLEQYQYGPEIVYSFAFDGETDTFVDTTAEFRQELAGLLESRRIFSDWKRHGSMEHYFSFQADPSWAVAFNEKVQTYTVRTASGAGILSVALMPYEGDVVFSALVLDELQEKFGETVLSYSSDTFTVDMDIPRVKLYSELDPKTFYIAATGPNKMFYRVTMENEQLARQIFRTMEVMDGENEPISLDQ